MVICGIDPGLSGALAFYDTLTHNIEILDIPTFALVRNGKAKREIDPTRLSVDIDHAVGHAFIERVGAMPGQGLSSTFSFGVTYGVIRGVLAARGVPVSFVAPQVWKKGLGVPAAKDGARARASQLLPSHAHLWPRVKDDGRAEAALIALWGERALNAIAA